MLVGYNGQKKDAKESDAKYMGADGPTLTISGFSTDDQGEYWCVITNRHQSDDVKSNPAKLALGKCCCLYISILLSAKLSVIIAILHVSLPIHYNNKASISLHTSVGVPFAKAIDVCF